MAVEAHHPAHPATRPAVLLVAIVPSPAAAPSGAERAHGRVELHPFEAFFVLKRHHTTPAPEAMRTKLLYMRNPISPLFSGWNCVAAMFSRATTDGKVTP